MTNVTLFKAAGLPANSLDKLEERFSSAKAQLNVSTGGNFLKLDKADGVWVYGTAGTEVEEGSRWAVNPMTLKTGYLSWLKGELAGRSMRPVLEGVVDRESLSDTGANWQEAMSMDMACIDGEDEGTQLTYEQTSYGARKAFDGILDAIKARYAVDPESIVPVITLSSESYQHKEYGTIYNPVLTIVGWATAEGEVVNEVDAGEEEAPARVRRQAVTAPKAPARAGRGSKPAPKAAAKKAPVRKGRR